MTCTFAVFAPSGVSTITSILVFFFLPVPASGYGVAFNIAVVTPNALFVGIITLALTVLIWVIFEVVAVAVILVILVVVLRIFIMCFCPHFFSALSYGMAFVVTVVALFVCIWIGVLFITRAMRLTIA